MSKLCLYVFKKNLRQNFILVCQVVMTLFFLNLMIGHINLMSYTSSLFVPFDMQNGGIFMPISNNALPACLQDSKYVESVSTIEQYLVYYQELEIPMFAYDDRLASLTLSGFPRMSQNSDEIPVYITKNSFQIYPREEININDHGGNSAKVRVMGQLEEPTFIFNLDFTSNRASPNSLYRYYNAEYFGFPVMVTTKNAIEESKLESVYTQHSLVVFFSPDIQEDEKINVISELKRYGEFTTFGEISARGEEFIHEIYKRYAPILVCAFSISIVGLLGLTVLTILKCMKVISVIYILGCPWRKCTLLCFGNATINACISAVIVVIGLYLINIIAPFASQGMIIRINNVYISLCLFLLLLAISAATPQIALIGNPPIKFLKETLKD